jgi:hypothetical protein
MQAVACCLTSLLILHSQSDTLTLSLTLITHLHSHSQHSTHSHSLTQALIYTRLSCYTRFARLISCTLAVPRYV